MIKMNKRHKDSVFRALFSDKENFLSLYNALHQTNLQLENTSVVEIEIPQTMYTTYKNDVSMIINDRIIVLMEHQSTINENMPFRCLEYITRIYDQLLRTENRYREKIIPLPNPEFYVFYNGQKNYPNNTVLKLSDAFEPASVNPSLELTVLVKNIQSSTNPVSELQMMNVCNILKQYTEFIEIVQEYQSNRKGIKRAVEEAISRNILKDFLEDNFKEVVNMLCARYSYKTDVKVKSQEAFEQGEKQGKAEGKIEGMDLEKYRIATEMLNHKMSITTISEITGLPEEEILRLK